MGSPSLQETWNAERYWEERKDRERVTFVELFLSETGYLHSSVLTKVKFSPSLKTNIVLVPTKCNI